MPEAISRTGTVLTIAPRAWPLPDLLRLAIDAEQVEVARIHLPAGLDDRDATVAAIRARTGLLVTTEPLPGLASPSIGSAAVIDGDVRCRDLVLPESDPAMLARQLVDLAESAGPDLTFVAGRAGSALTVTLLALPLGLHIRVGTADLAVANGFRDDIRLAARAAGLARIAERPPISAARLRGVLSEAGSDDEPAADRRGQ